MYRQLHCDIDSYAVYVEFFSSHVINSIAFKKGNSRIGLIDTFNEIITSNNRKTGANVLALVNRF